ncbi:TetR family transcriptional regulator [Nonomuraea phyllanthi]|uniref:TetR family transcriptional regulator n=1 Tax=Nonomuraea phyllanthi TaxID=2219224 RepID=A0A5C4WIG0_9ACTN|nr:TetR family transcriptional regulator [Nonomuraea phyllanthi]KAB8194224.1 TetR family transcriptional regulator [Nonomuraea phyllanthi]QFY07823.1 TetR family transcriptional regulator [Nonomuraea phyllanthi]
MPKLWNETIEAHRRTVHDAILDATVELVRERGLLAVTMSQIAEKTGIGRATLYKYFPDVETILAAWHGRHVAAHLEQLARAGERGGDAGQRLEAVLETYALIHHQMARHGFGPDLVALLHRPDDVGHAQHRLSAMLRDALADAARAGAVRDDVAPDELAAFCLHALRAGAVLPSQAAVRRLVAVTLAGLRAR